MIPLHLSAIKRAQPVRRQLRGNVSHRFLLPAGMATALAVAPQAAPLMLHDTDCRSAFGAWRSALGAVPVLVDWCGERGLSVGPLREHAL